MLRTSRGSRLVHRKNIRISTDILWRVFRGLTEPVLYAFVSVNPRNNEAPAHIAMWPGASLFRRFTAIFTVYCEDVTFSHCDRNSHS